MKKHLLLICIILFTVNSYAQISYENGYIINKDGEKIDCLVKNGDWQDNPTKFDYKLTETSDKQVGNLENTKAFGLNNVSKYVKNWVKIDRSDEDLEELSYDSEAIFQDELLFLKVLVEGEASLYSYTDGKLKRYFYKKGDAPIEQLVYKLFNTSNNKIHYNKNYKQQLWRNLKCPTVSFAQVENVEYRKGELVDFFVNYNKCNNATFFNFERKQKQDLFNLNIRPGLKYSTLAVYSDLSSSLDIDFGGGLGFRLGVEMEFIMPFNKNKWGIIIEPTYQSFKAEKEISISLVTVDYSSIETSFGIRHYFFLNDKSKVFVDAAFTLDLNMESSISFYPGTDLVIATGNSLSFGIGYKYNDKISIQLRSQTNREMFNNLILWYSAYRTSSVVFSYSIF